MGEDALGTSGFEFYEGIRILIPGAVVVALYAAIRATFQLHTASASDALAGFVLALMSGLLLYFIDFSGRSQIYSQAQPHRVLEQWIEERKLTPPRGLSATNLYFVLIDTTLPPGIRS